MRSADDLGDSPGDLAAALRDFARARDWERFHTPKNLAMALAGEAGELVACFHNPNVPQDVASKAQVELAGGIPFLSDQDLQAQLDKAGVPPKEADAIVTENANARIDGLRSSLALLAIIALIALFATRRIPAQQPTASPESEPTALTGEP